MKNYKKVAAVSVAAIMTCGVLSGCDLVTTDMQKNLGQVIAEVDISKGEDFAKGGEYEKYADVVQSSEILKRDMFAMFMSVGYQYVNSGYSYKQVCDMIKDSLVNRKTMVQYATVYFLDNDDAYTVEGYKAAVSADKDHAEVAGLSYFLSEDDKAQAEYELKVMVNNTIDQREEDIIAQKKDEDEKTYDTARTLPTGVNTQNEDYRPEKYEIYTGKNSLSACGEYEAVEDSTPATRKKAYNSFLTDLYGNNLIEKGEDTSDFTKLEYYYTELLGSYESALIEKFSDAIEKKVEDGLTDEMVAAKFQSEFEDQKNSDTTSFTSTLDSMSDSSFVLYTPDKNYGFVINILLPFSKSQTEALNGAIADGKGNTFAARANLLKNVMATDQRGTWFTCEEDYSYLAGEGAFTNGNAEREYLFFEDCNGVAEGGKYEPLKNYYGQYTYNGKVAKNDDGDYVLTPNKVDINGFINEMEGYLNFALGAGSASGVYQNGGKDGYFAQSDFYKEDGSVDYSKFLYYQGNVSFGESFNPNRVFVRDSNENKAFSVINELSFAYNTDTAGLNKYLGYSVSAFDTNFVKEFEYAAKAAVEGGAGTYTVAPSVYGWHIMYCTFSYNVAKDDGSVYTYNPEERDVEGSFSNLYYENYKDSLVNGYAQKIQTKVINNYASCVVVYENRYADIASTDANS